MGVHFQNYAFLYSKFLVNELKYDGGIFVLNCVWNTPEAVEKNIPNALLRNIAKKKAIFYVIDANNLALKVGLGKRTNTVMQAVF